MDENSPMSWLFRSLRWKIALPVVVSTAVVILLFAQITTTHVRRTLESRERVNLLVLARSLSERSETWLAVMEGDGERARGSVRELLARYAPIFRVALYQLDKKNRPRLLLTEGSRESTLLPSWKSLLTSGVEQWEEDGETGFLITTPVWVEKQDRVVEELTQDLPSAPSRVRGGALVLWSSNDPIELAVGEYLWSVLPFGLLLFLLLTIFCITAVRRLLRHLERLALAVESFGEGADDVRVDVEGGDEIASLANSFNRMARRLLESRRSIEDYNRNLETEVEARTRELRDAFEELKTLDHAKDTFLSSVSHEMRTPLTSIRSFAELLLDYGDDEKPEVRREFLTIIKKESERLTRLINQVLDLARIEAGKVTWRVIEVELRRLLDRAVKSLSGLAYQKQVGFRVDYPEAEVLYQGDKDGLYQVLVNLLSNAWKFSPPYGTVAVDLRLDRGTVEVRVTDSGPGVPSDEAKELIFDKFRQIGDTLTEKPMGTGLGLPICKEIVQAHGGEIFCLDNPEGGAIFVLRLPPASSEHPRKVDEPQENAWTGLAGLTLS